MWRRQSADHLLSDAGIRTGTQVEIMSLVLDAEN
jgi:hypothetical protein